MSTLEICVDSVGSAITAEVGGAQRLELCSALADGGITPSLGLIQTVRCAVAIPLHVLVRPRAGNFIYTDEEIEVMRKDIRIAADAGADGVVFGLLTERSEVDVQRTRMLTDLARPMQVTFHRAIDLTRNLTEAFGAVVSCGADRVLTSGAEINATLGAQRIHDLVHAYAQRLRVMVGGHVRPDNVEDLVRRTGAREWHSALRRPVPKEGWNTSSAVDLAEQFSAPRALLPLQLEDVCALRDALLRASDSPTENSSARPETSGIEN